MKLVSEIVFYVVLVLVLVYAARQLEGVAVGRFESNVPSFLEFLK